MEEAAVTFLQLFTLSLPVKTQLHHLEREKEVVVGEGIDDRRSVMRERMMKMVWKEKAKEGERTEDEESSDNDVEKGMEIKRKTRSRCRWTRIIFKVKRSRRHVLSGDLLTRMMNVWQDKGEKKKLRMRTPNEHPCNYHFTKYMHGCLSRFQNKSFPTSV